MLLPSMKGESFDLFMEHFEAFLQHKAIMILDGASSHRSHPDSNIKLVHLPAKCPELNPVERFFKDMRVDLANQVFENIEQVENRIMDSVQKYIQNPQKVIQLTLYPYVDASFLN